MPTATDSATVADRPADLDCTTRTPRLVHVVEFRRRPSERWMEVFATSSAEAAWLWSLECRASGHYRYRTRPTEPFDAGGSARQGSG